MQFREPEEEQRSEVRDQRWAGTVSRASSVVRCALTFWNSEKSTALKSSITLSFIKKKHNHMETLKSKMRQQKKSSVDFINIYWLRHCCDSATARSCLTPEAREDKRAIPFVIRWGWGQDKARCAHIWNLLNYGLWPEGKWFWWEITVVLHLYILSLLYNGY